MSGVRNPSVGIKNLHPKRETLNPNLKYVCVRARCSVTRHCKSAILDLERPINVIICITSLRFQCKALIRQLLGHVRHATISVEKKSLKKIHSEWFFFFPRAQYFGHSNWIQTQTHSCFRLATKQILIILCTFYHLFTIPSQVVLPTTFFGGFWNRTVNKTAY